ncbi:hypothetical protein M0638_19655 [Roseomonas sp. NAR14]|uniref:Uncharacterized protein n=1 Tax=Roseomonas acroporae TaxID=2937791 RepID=A0A9X1YBD0_9PROT|nr:hypothetical protein [Roseomonas acroporae]MCK8786595.1 hypothetical protein [Roseomonas acroporae]
MPDLYSHRLPHAEIEPGFMAVFQQPGEGAADAANRAMRDFPDCGFIVFALPSHRARRGSAGRRSR